MNKQLLNSRNSMLLLCFFYAILANAQHLVEKIGTNRTTINPSAVLELESSQVAGKAKGFLPPRVALTGTTDVATILAPATSLQVYNTATAGTTPNNVVPGYYYYNGTKWVAATGYGSNNWALTGNSGITPATNFLGTTDAQDVAIRTNNIEKMRVTSVGNVGIGTTTPVAKLDVAGTVKIADGTQGADKVLTSDANGLASWKMPISTDFFVTLMPPAETHSVVFGDNDFYSAISFNLTEGTWEIEYENWGSLYDLSQAVQEYGFFYCRLSTSSTVIAPPSSFLGNKTCLSIPYVSAKITTDNTRIISGKWLIDIPAGGQIIYLWNGVWSTLAAKVDFYNNAIGAIGPYSYCYARRAL